MIDTLPRIGIPHTPDDVLPVERFEVLGHTITNLSVRLRALIAHQQVLLTRYTPPPPLPVGRPKNRRSTESFESVEPGGSDLTWIESRLEIEMLEIDEERVLLREHAAIRHRYREAIATDPGKALPATRSAHASLQDINERFIGANIRLVKWVAIQFKHKGVPYGDLIIAGISGLLEALEKFDVEQFPNQRFASYATWLIRRALQDAVERENCRRITRVPIDKDRMIGAVMRGENEGKSLEEVAKEQGVGVELLRRAYAVGRYSSINTQLEDDEIGDFLQHVEGVSIADQDDGNSTVDCRHGGVLEPVLDDIMVRDRADALNDALEVILSPRELELIKLRFFGGDSREGLSLRRVGEIMGISKERERQIQKRALRKIRRESGDLLHPFLAFVPDEEEASPAWDFDDDEDDEDSSGPAVEEGDEDEESSA